MLIDRCIIRNEVFYRFTCSCGTLSIIDYSGRRYVISKHVEYSADMVDEYNVIPKWLDQLSWRSRELYA